MLFNHIFMVIIICKHRTSKYFIGSNTNLAIKIFEIRANVRISLSFIGLDKQGSTLVKQLLDRIIMVVVRTVAVVREEYNGGTLV